MLWNKEEMIIDVRLFIFQCIITEKVYYEKFCENNYHKLLYVSII